MCVCVCVCVCFIVVVYSCCLIIVAAAVDMLAARPLPAGARWSVFVKVDCGYHRAGLLPDDAITCAVAVSSNPATT